MYSVPMESSPLIAPANQIPAAIRMAQDYVDVSRGFLSESCYEYITGGSGLGMSAVANLAAFNSLSVYPRVLQPLEGRHTRLTVPGASLAHPIFLAPVAHQKLAHPNGERETVRAAEAVEACMVASTLTSCSLEEIAVTAPNATRWFQLYLQPDPRVTADLIRRAEVAGYQAIMVTLDASLQVANRRAIELGFRMPQGVAPNLERYPADASPEFSGRILQSAASRMPTRQDLEHVLATTSLPVWVKGVLHPDDAIALKDMGVAGIVVSNHGGRGLDGAPASLHALPAIRSAVGGDFPLLLDGGIRSGLDVFKALSRGADGVMVGRMQMYGLSVAGALGVAHMLRSLREELEITMALTGCGTLLDIRSAMLGSVSP